MKKTLYILFVLIISIICTQVDAKTIYLRECEYTDEYKNWLKLSEEERANTIAPTMCESFGTDKFALLGSSSTLSSVSVNDSKFDLRDYGYVTDVKNQGVTGSCWAFATNASIESNLLVSGKGTYDLSEAHMEMATQDTHEYNRLTFSRDVDKGGNYYISSAYLRNNWGPVLEADLPFDRLEELYENNTAISEDSVLNNTAMLDVNSVSMFGNSGSCNSNTIQDIKEYLITNGALTSMAYYGNTSSYNLYQYYDGASYKKSNDEVVKEGQPANHAITIVGWDDTISKDNFLTEKKPSKDGAFIIKNSYGIKDEIDLWEYRQEVYEALTEEFNEIGIYKAEDISDELLIKLCATANDIEISQIKIENNKIVVSIGDGGYQYISYDDIYICNNLVGFFEVDTEIEDYVYGYDTFGLSGMVDFASGKVGYLANIFEKQSDSSEELVEVNIYFTNVGQEYEIYFADRETKDVNLATLVAKGTSKFAGYNTIQIDNATITNDKYSIIIKIVGKGALSLGISMKNTLSINSLFKNVTFIEGVQYLSIDGIEFADVTKGITPFHFLVKAYTNETEDVDGEIIPPSIEEEEPEEDDSEIIPPSIEEEPEEDDSEIIPPSTGEEDPKDDDESLGSDEKLPGDDEEQDNTTDDGKIEILPNDTSNKNDNNNGDSSVENPDTGDMMSYILFVSVVMLGIGLISYLRVRKIFK